MNPFTRTPTYRTLTHILIRPFLPRASLRPAATRTLKADTSKAKSHSNSHLKAPSPNGYAHTQRVSQRSSPPRALPPPSKRGPYPKGITTVERRTVLRSVEFQRKYAKSMGGGISSKRLSLETLPSSMRGRLTKLGTSFSDMRLRTLVLLWERTRNSPSWR